MRVQLIDVPFDSGHWSVRMGRGPAAILAGGLAEELTGAGHEVKRALTPVRFPTEIATGFDLCGEVSRLVRAGSGRSAFRSRSWVRVFPVPGSWPGSVGGE